MLGKHTMNAPLDISEQILLSAWLDGEVSDAERDQVNALLQRAEARAYLEQLKATRVLVNKHGSVSAPVGLKGRVLAALDEDFDDISRPTASRDGNVIALPTASWKTPLMALAAAVVIVLGLVFGPSLIPSSTPQSPADIAREAAGRATPQDPAPATSTVEKKPVDSNLDLLEPGTAEELAQRLKLREQAPPEAGPELDKAGRNDDSFAETEKFAAKKPEGTDVKLGKASAQGAKEEAKSEAKSKDAQEDPVAPPAPQPSALPRDGRADELERKRGESHGEDRGTGGPGADAKKDEKDAAARKVENSPAESEAPGTRREGQSTPAPGSPAKELDDKPKTNAAGGGGADAGKKTARPADDEARKLEDTEDSNNEDSDGKQGEGAAEKGNGDWRGGDDLKSKTIAATTIDLTLAPDRALAAQNDVLRVAALYGKAVITVNEADGTESITVDLNENQLAELVGALKRLAAQQNYGNVQVPETLRDEVARNGATASTTARDSLPNDVKVQVDGAQPAQEDTTKTAPAKARLVINLK